MSETEGWAKPLFGIKWHYIVGKDSLCGMWINVPGPYEETMKPLEEYCPRCAYEAGKRRAMKEAEDE